jgi:ATP-binding cassette subfamily B protein
MTARSSRVQHDNYRQARRRAGSNDLAVAGEASSKKSRRQRSFGVLLVEFFKLLRGQRFAVAVALATLTVSTLLKLVPPAATKIAIDNVLTEGAASARATPEWFERLSQRFVGEGEGGIDEKFRLLCVLAAIVAAVSLVQTAIHLWGRWRATKAVNRMQMTVRRRAFAHALRLPLPRVYQLKSGGAASLLRDDAGGVGELIFSMLYNPWQAIIQLIGSLIVLVWVDWRLLVGAAVLIPITYFTQRTWINRIRPLYRDIRNKRQEIDGQATEAFGGIRIVRAFNRERSETGRYVRSTDLVVRQSLFVWWWSRLIEICWAVLIPLASTGLLLYGGREILRGELTLGDLTMFLFYLAMLLDPLATLAATATGFQNNLAGFDRVLDLLQEPAETASDAAALPIVRSRVAGRLEFKNVSFGYPQSESLVLKEIDFTAMPGQTVALVGRSGAGKTTLCNLAARFYDPSEGAIELDGVDLRKLRIDDYRRLLGVVEQDVFLFDGTIRENIAYAAKDALPQEVEAAARAAHAHEFISSFENGYETVIGERGVRLSGGQRQRLAIARAILADPRILILDEATSNLDSESEQLIQQALGELLQGRTCFVIAHRLSTIAHADQIVVLDEGRIVESGTHAELMAASGAYRQMVELQMGETMVT